MKRNAPIHYICLLLIITIFQQEIHSQEYSIRRYAGIDEPGNAYIYTLSQDSLGYLWIGTGDGLIRYNGFHFSKYTVSDSLADDFVSAGIRDGLYMWFGHRNGGLTRYIRNHFEKIKTGLPDDDPVSGFAKDQQGRVWMSTYNGSFAQLDPQRGVVRKTGFKTGLEVLTFVFAGEDSILVGNSSGLMLCILHPNEITDIRMIPSTVNSQIIKIIRRKDGKGYYAAAPEKGIYVLDTELNVVSRIDADAGIQDISEGISGELWVATFGKSVIRMDPKNGWNEVREAGENIKTLFISREGILWCGGYGSGLAAISKNMFTVIHFNNTLQGNNIRALCPNNEYSWIATDKALLKTDLNGTVLETENIPGDEITALHLYNNLELWIGTRTKGIYRKNLLSGRIKSFSTGPGELENSITCIAGNTGNIWIGTKKGLCHVKMPGEEIEWYSISRGGLPHNSINGLYIDRTGKLWISSRSNILAYIKNGQVKRIPMGPGNGALAFDSFAEDEKSFIWAGSSGSGIFRIHPDTLIQLNSGNGLYSDFCYAILCDRSNHIWVMHQDGLSRINTGNYFVRKISRFGDTNSPVLFSEGAFSEDKNGTLWLGTQNGLILINHEDEPDPVPIPEILSIKINDEERMNDSRRIILRPGKYKVQIDFIAVNLRDPDRTVYKTLLDGYEKTPVLSTLRNVTYNNLTQGKYRFILSAINGDGVSSGIPQGIEVLIRTPFMKQWWFYPVLTVTSALLLFFYLKRREYIFTEERKKLEQKVQERTREIQQQKNEIEEQRDLIRAKNAEITSSIRYALEIQNAVLPAPASIDRHLPENFVFVKAKDIVSGDFYWFTRKNDKIVFTVADCTGHGVPGAFMSLLSIAILNEIVNIEGITQSDKIVNRLHTMINRSLNKSRMDGLDLALCVFDANKSMLQYTGAMNHLVYIRSGELYTLKADQFSVNMAQDENRSFSKQELEIKKGDIIYLYTDGYMDQFGGAKDKKYSIKRFYNTLIEIHRLPMKDQEMILLQRLTDWKNERVQTDDIAIMGVRF